MPSSVSAEIFAHAGFDWLCIDTHHGLIDYQTSVTMLQTISPTETVPIVRVPWNEPGIIMKTLDAGAYGVIIPMVNSRGEAQAAASACRYPPRGLRSYGPGRSVLYAGMDYYPAADDEVLCIVMIETSEALEDLENILSVPGIDAVYIGPSDLSVSLGLPPAYDHDDPQFMRAIDAVLDACRRHNVAPGVHAGNVTVARKRIEQGFLMVETCDDYGSLARAAAGSLRELRGEGAGEGRAAPA